MKTACVDLFCGAGGLTHGFVKEGIKVTAGIDLDAACEFPYRKNNNGAHFINRDIKDLSKSDLDKYFAGADVKILAGCAPCQPFSTYAQRYDIKRNSKWGLLYEFIRLTDACNPDIVTMENVPSLVRHEVFLDFVQSLKSSGYHVWYEVIKSADYGVPQTRKRMVLLASKMGDLRLSECYKERAMTVRETIGNLEPIPAGSASKRDPLHMSASLSKLNLKRIKASKPGGSWKDWPPNLVAACHRSQSGRTYSGVYGRMEWDKEAPTMTTQCFGYGNGRFGHPEQDRAISLREAALFQSFPLNYQFVPDGGIVNMSALGRLIGNAVPVKLAQAIAKSINNHIKLFK